MKLQIYEEFKNLIPPLTEEEFKQLEENIKEDGCREPLVTWNGVIIDGHNRYNICKKNDVPFKTEEKEFLNKEDVTEWIIRNQFGRRNLSLIQRGELALILKPIIQEKAKINKVSAMKIARESNPNNSNEQFCQNSAKTVKKVDTKKELAKIAGVSHDTITKTEKILKAGTTDQINRARQGGKGNSLNAIYKEIKQEKEETKLCKKCGQMMPISDFYKGKSMCKYCYNTSNSVQRDVKGNTYKIAEEYKHLKHEDLIGNLYNTEEVAEQTIEDAIELFQANFETFLISVDLTMDPYIEQIKKDNDKMMKVLSDAVITMREWKGKYNYGKQ